MNNIIKVGSSVRLKTGTQLMQVNSIEGGVSCYCYWIDSNQKMQYSTFRIEGLMEVCEKEIKKFHKKEAKRKDALAGATISDKVAKWATFISAIGVITVGVMTFTLNDTIKDLKKTIIDSQKDIILKTDSKIQKK